MIPKKIHYCWFSEEPFSEKVQECIASWERNMPDWEYVLWDYDKIKNIDSVWLKECIENKKWAFAADFVRLWAVYHEGGIYLDSDVMIYKPFDIFLCHSFFTGREGVSYVTFDDGIQVFLTSHCFGAEAGHPFLELNLAYYQDRHFQSCTSPDVPKLLRYDMLMMPYIQSQLAEMYGYNPMLDADNVQELKYGMVVYPSAYFGKGETNNADISLLYAEHIGQGSWREPEYWEKHSKHFKVTFPYKIRWRIVSLLKRIALLFDYQMIRIHPDGGE